MGIPTLTDLGYENAGTGFRHPVKKPRGSELAEPDQAFNAVIRGVHAVAERANALLKVTFKALRRVSLDPSAITRIARASPRPPATGTRPHSLKITNRHDKLPRRLH